MKYTLIRGSYFDTTNLLLDIHLRLPLLLVTKCSGIQFVQILREVLGKLQKSHETYIV